MRTKSMLPTFLGLHHLYGKDDWLTVSGEHIPQWIYHKNEIIAQERPMYSEILDGNCTGIDANYQLIGIDCNTPLAYFCEIRY